MRVPREVKSRTPASGKPLCRLTLDREEGRHVRPQKARPAELRQPIDVSRQCFRAALTRPKHWSTFPPRKAIAVDHGEQRAALDLLLAEAAPTEPPLCPNLFDQRMHALVNLTGPPVVVPIVA